MRRIVPAERAKPGDLILVDGELRELVSATSAGDFIEAKCEKEIREYKGEPLLTRHSITAICALAGDTTGRERRNMERARAKAAKQLRRSA